MWVSVSKALHPLSVSFCCEPVRLCVMLMMCVQEDSRYEQVEDVRSQLKFFEQLDLLEKQKKEEQEREILMKAAKVSKPPPAILTHSHSTLILLI